MIKIGMMIGDRYEILEKIGTGGMSDVYKAKCHKLNRYVAIKVLKQEFSENANFVSKFRIEAQAAAGLEHPNIVLTRSQLLEEIWGYDFDGETRTVDVHIRTLRQKLEESGALIETIRGVGYRIGDRK